MPVHINKSPYFREQDTVQSNLQNDSLTGSSATEEDRKTDIRFLVEQVTRAAWFFMIVKDTPPKKFVQDAQFLKTFYGTPHKQIVRILNVANVSVFSIAFFFSCDALALSSIQRS